MSAKSTGLGGSTVRGDEAEDWRAAPIPLLTIAFHPDARRVGERSFLNDPQSRDAIRLSRACPDFGAPGQPDEHPLGDRHLSRQPLWLVPAREGMTLRAAPDATAVSLDGRPFVGERTFTPAELAQGVILELAKRVVLVLHTTTLTEPAPEGDLGLIGASQALAEVRSRILKVAVHDVPVLLRGESGTGKELVAAAIHARSKRARRPLVSVNMAALLPTTAASALFGHTRGAFTGATDASVGFFGRADGGTLFLDEIGDTPAEVQPALLRALESGQIQVLGSDRPVPRDVRLITATDADLERAVASGAFRLPLLQRLQGYVIDLPPLRRRREDIGRLWFHFLREALAEAGRLDRLEGREDGPPWLPATLLSRALLHDWPGNVRELRNVVRQLVIDFGDSDRVPAAAPLPLAAVPSTPPAPPEASPAPAERRPSEIGEDELVVAMRAHRHRPEAVARALGISKTSLYALIEKSGRIRKAADLTSDEIREALARSGGDIEAAAESLEVSARGLKLRMKQLGRLPG